jgi:hypothetical protein
MTTVVNTPGTTDNGSGWGFFLGIIVLIVAIILFFIYGLPAIRNNNRGEAPRTTNINVEVPNPLSGSNNNDSGASGGTSGGTSNAGTGSTGGTSPAPGSNL